MKSFLLRIFDFWTLVHTRDPLRRRKGYLLAVTLGIFLASLIILTIANVISYLQEPTSEVVNFLWMDAIDIVFFAALWWLNRAGRIRLASYLFLVFVITFITVGFPADTFNRVLLAYAIPILTASFLIEPASAFPAVLFSIMGYTLRYFYDGRIYSYNTLSLLALIMVAMVALTAARQLDRALEASTLQQVKLAESQAHDRILFEESPVALWEEDFSRVKVYLEELRAQGVSDFRTYLLEHPDARRHCESLVIIRDVNQAALKMSGFNTMEELLASELLVLQRSPLENAVLIDELAAIAAGETHFEEEGPNDVVDGKLRYHHVQFAVVPGHEHDYSKILFSIQDITERIKAEETLQFQSELLDQIGDLVIATDLQGNITYANKAECELFNLPCGELLGKNIRILGSALHKDLIEDDIVNTALIEGSWSGELTNTLSDGSTITRFARVWLLRDGDGKPEGICSVSTDVTTLRQMESDLIQAQKMANVGTLAAGVAHEINSPLQIITGLSGSILRRLEQGAPDVERLRRNVYDINRSSWRVAEIVRSLLAYSRISSGYFETVDLNVLVKDSLALLENLLRAESNILVSTDLDPELPSVRCNHNEISQVLINLLTNARDAMPRGGKIAIRTRLDDSTNKVLIDVTDTGKGISSENLTRIFTPFFTTKPLGKGTGLGLAICRRIVRMHGGEITASSAPGKGTTITIHLPLVPPDPDSTQFQENISLLS